MIRLSEKLKGHFALKASAYEKVEYCDKINIIFIEMNCSLIVVQHIAVESLSASGMNEVSCRQKAMTDSVANIIFWVFMFYVRNDK